MSDLIAPVRRRVSPEEEDSFRRTFPGSNHQQILHNHLVGRIASLRVELETTTAEALSARQAVIRELRSLLGFTHQHDSKEVARTYAS